MHNKSPRQSALLAAEDLKRLAESSKFRQAISNLRKSLKRNSSPTQVVSVDEVSRICGDFSILDHGWIEDLAREWDLKSPLPIPKHPWCERPEMAAWLAKDNLAPMDPESERHKFVESISSRTVEPDFCGTEVRTIPGSPKTWYRKSVLKDGDGERYLTISVRLTPDLSEKWLEGFVKDALRWAQHSSPRKTKPSLRKLSFTLLQGTRRRWSSNNQAAAWLCEEIKKKDQSLSLSTALTHVRAFNAARIDK